MTKTKTDPRSEAKKAKDAAFAKLPANLIISPLKFILCKAPKLPILGTRGEIIGYELSPEYKRARIAADRGNGDLVKSIARAVALAA